VRVFAEPREECGGHGGGADSKSGARVRGLRHNDSERACRPANRTACVSYLKRERNRAERRCENTEVEHTELEIREGGDEQRVCKAQRGEAGRAKRREELARIKIAAAPCDRERPEARHQPESGRTQRQIRTAGENQRGNKNPRTRHYCGRDVRPARVPPPREKPERGKRYRYYNKVQILSEARKPAANQKAQERARERVDAAGARQRADKNQGKRRNVPEQRGQPEQQTADRYKRTSDKASFGVGFEPVPYVEIQSGFRFHFYFPFIFTFFTFLFLL